MFAASSEFEVGEYVSRPVRHNVHRDRKAKIKPQEPRTAPLEARIAPEAFAIVRRAAEIQGRGVSDFVVAASQDAALRTVAEVEVIRLSREGQKSFVSLLLNPPPSSAALARALTRHRLRHSREVTRVCS